MEGLARAAGLQEVPAMLMGRSHGQHHLWVWPLAALLTPPFLSGV